MKSIRFEINPGLRLPKELQLKRIRQAMEGVLTQKQREVLVAFYFNGQRVTDIALERGVNKSTVSRTLKRAERRLQECLRY